MCDWLIDWGYLRVFGRETQRGAEGKRRGKAEGFGGKSHQPPWV